MSHTVEATDEVQSHTNDRLGATINSDTYLYGRSIIDIKSEPYEVVLLAKLHLVKLLMYDLVHINNMEDTKRISAVKKAEEFNRELLKEILYTDKDIREALLVLEKTKDLNLVGSKQITATLINNLNESLNSVKDTMKSAFNKVKGLL